MNSLLYAHIEVEQRQAFADAAGGHADGAGDAGQRGASIEQVAVRSGLLPGGMYLFVRAEFILELAVCLVNINQNLRFGHQISEGRAPRRWVGAVGAGLRPAPTCIVVER